MNKPHVPQRFVWIDCEMTGLNPQVDVLLEIATIITDENLQEIAQGPDLIIFQPEHHLDAMHPDVMQLHSASGLIDRVRESDVMLEDAYSATLACIKQYCTGYQTHLAGNSIWQDAAFLRRYMPHVMQQVHYRMLDVSSFKIAIQAWYQGDQYAHVHKAKRHRALDDIRESINELKQYRTHFFKA